MLKYIIVYSNLKIVIEREGVYRLEEYGVEFRYRRRYI